MRSRLLRRKTLSLNNIFALKTHPISPHDVNLAMFFNVVSNKTRLLLLFLLITYLQTKLSNTSKINAECKRMPMPKVKSTDTTNNYHGKVFARKATLIRH